jgi:fructose-bisphosphate aldolase class II
VKNLKYYFKKAEKEKWAIGAFNFAEDEIFQAIVKAGQKLKAPVILAISERSSRKFGLEKAAELFKKIEGSFFLHLDHSKNFEYIKKAIDLGFNSVHFDGSGIDLDKNIKTSRKVVEYAHPKNILVEGEINPIGGELTDVEEAERFIKESGVDSLAVNIGNIHGVEKSGQNPPLDLKRLAEIKKIGFPLVLHGGSGTSEKDIKEAVKLGIVKININTELKIAYKEGGEEAVEKTVEEKIKLFGSTNKIC